MDARTASDREQTHFDSVPVDLHPSPKVSLFQLFNQSFLCRLFVGLEPSRREHEGRFDQR